MEFFRMGFEPVLEIAAEHGDGVAELLDEIVKLLPEKKTLPAPVTETAVAIVGRPNVGKSSLVNRLLREERVMVSEMPGTTRDTVDVVLHWHQRQFRIVDTAGMRRPGKVHNAGQVEAERGARAPRDGARRCRRAGRHARRPATEGAIAGEAEETGSGIIIASTNGTR
jgi:GTP-binding protein